MNKSELISIRTGTVEDTNFIYATWLRGLYHGDSWFSLIKPKDVFMKHYHEIITNILSNSVIKVACLKDDTSVILGYAVFNKDETALCYAFVKKNWRRIGVCRDLLGDKVKTTTHLTDVGRSILKNHPEWVFNPFLT